MTYGLGAIALVLAARLLRLHLPLRRLLAVAGVILAGAIAGDLLASALVTGRIMRQLLEETIQVVILSTALVWATRARVRKAVAVSVLAGTLRVLFVLTIEVLWALYVFNVGNYSLTTRPRDH